MTTIYKVDERQERVENGLLMLTELQPNLNDRVNSLGEQVTMLGTSLEARMTTQEKVIDERF